MKTPLVHFIICCCNNRQIIDETLQTVMNQTEKDIACTVIDGKSSDGTAEYVRQEYPWVRVVVKKEDSGPAASRNIGISLNSSPFLVFLDSDVTLTPTWTEEQLRFLGSGYDVACGKLLYASRPGILNAAGGAMNRFGIGWNNGGGLPIDQFSTVQRCLWTNSSAMMVRREVVETAGGFDEAMFAACEDSDFGWRANLFGYRVAFNPEAVAMHKAHSSINPGSMGPEIIYLCYRNRIRSALINYEAWNAFRYVGCYLILALADALTRSPRKPKLQALWWNITSLSDTLRRRRDIQKRRVRSDAELWHLFSPGFRGPGIVYE